MSTPIAHIMCTYALCKERKRLKLISFCLIGSVFPDFDMIAGQFWESDHLYYHGKWSHSPIFYIAAYIILNGILGNSRIYLKYFIFGCMLHILIDGFTGPILGFNLSNGIYLIYPFEETHIQFPFTLFLGPMHGEVKEMINIHNLWVILYDIGFSVFLLLLRRRLL